MASRALPPWAVEVRRFVRVFVVWDLAIVAGTVLAVSLSVDLIAGLALALPGCAWVVADMGSWDFDPPAMKFRRVLACAGCAVSALYVFLEPDGGDFALPSTWLWVGQLATGLLGILVLTLALAAAARVHWGAPGSGPLPKEGPAEIYPPLLVNPPRRSHV